MKFTKMNAYIPLFLLFLLILKKEIKIILSVEILRLFIKEELLFRIIPFIFMNKNIKNCFILGIFHGVYHSIYLDFDFLKFLFYFISGFLYALKFKEYTIIQIRYFLLSILLNN